MKKLLVSVLSIFALVVMSSCSSNDDEDIITQYGDEVWTGLNLRQVQYLHDLADGNESLSLSLNSFKFYQRIGDKKWKKENFSDWCGLSVPGPSVINIYAGNSWTPLSMFNPNRGPHPLAMPLSVYRKETGFDKAFYVSTPIVLDSENRTISIDHMTFEILDVSNNDLELRHISPFTIGDNTSGQNRFDIKYVASSPSIPTPDKIIYYETAKEAYLAIIAMLREKFGNEFDLNPYLYPSVILDHPIVNLDRIETAILDGYLLDY